MGTLAVRLSPQALAKSLQLRMDAGRQRARALRGRCPTALAILINYVHNAIKFTHQGEVVRACAWFSKTGTTCCCAAKCKTPALA